MSDIKSKTYKNAEKEEIPFPKLIDYGDIQYTPDSLEDINKDEGDQFAQNITDISGNKTDIAVNAGGIAVNVTDISGNATQIGINASGISVNVGDIAGNTSNITANASQISLNVTNISGNSSSISVNVGNINLRVQKNDVINQINISTEGIKIKGENIILDGNTSVLGTFSVSGDVVSGGTITAVTIQTSSGSNRVEMTTTSDPSYPEQILFYRSGSVKGRLAAVLGGLTLGFPSNGAFSIQNGSTISYSFTYVGAVIGLPMSTKAITPSTNAAYSLGSSSYGWNNLYLKGSGNPAIARGGTGYIYLTSTEVVANKTVSPNSNNTFNLGSSSYNWKSLYLSNNIYLALASRISGSLIPTGVGFNVGSSSVRYTNVYADNFPASPILVSKSGLESFRKIERIRNRKGKYTLETSSLPEEFKITDEKGIQHTELKRTIGLTVQAVGELIKKTDDLETKVNQLINK